MGEPGPGRGREELASREFPFWEMSLGDGRQLHRDTDTLDTTGQWLKQPFYVVHFTTKQCGQRQNVMQVLQNSGYNNLSCFKK